MAEDSTPAVWATDNPIAEGAIPFDPSLTGAGGSVSEMEQLADALRLIGDSQGSERVDQVILSMLEQKICRKVMARSRSGVERWSCFRR
jgi:hypothetical protein